MDTKQGYMLRLDGGCLVRDVTFTGEFPGNCYAILASAYAGVSDRTITIDGVTFRDFTQPSGSSVSPGGIQCESFWNDTTVVVTNCTFSNIQRTCVYVQCDAELIMSDCRLSGTPADPYDTVETGIVVDGHEDGEGEGIRERQGSRAELTNVTFSGFEYYDNSEWSAAALFLTNGGEADVSGCVFTNSDPMHDYHIAVGEGCSLTISGDLEAHSIWIAGDAEGANGGTASVTDNTGRWVLALDGGDPGSDNAYPDVRVKATFLLSADGTPDQIIDPGTTTQATVGATVSWTTGASGFTLDGATVDDLTLTWSLNGMTPATLPLAGPSMQAPIELSGLGPGVYTVELKLWRGGILMAVKTVTFTVANPAAAVPATGEDRISAAVWSSLVALGAIGMIFLLVRRRKVQREGQG